MGKVSDVANAFTTLKCATVSAAICTVTVLLAFCTPYWLKADASRVPEHLFANLGLWEICLNMTDPYHLYDQRWEGCWWIPLEDLWYMRQQIISPPFFIAVQVFFTLCLVFTIIGTIMVLMYTLCVAYDRRVCMLRSLSAVLMGAAICGLVAVIVFAIRGDGRDWMPYPDHNYLSWSFALAVIGTLCAFIAALLFFIEGNRIRRRERKDESYALQSKP